MNGVSRTKRNGGDGPTKSRRLRTSVEILRRFVAEQGIENLRRGTRVEGFHLGHWVTVRRSEHRQGTLPPWLREQLEAIPGWTWDPIDTRYRHFLQLLQDFAAEHGLDQLTSKTEYRGEPIGVWATCRRVDLRKGRLAEWVKTELDSIPGWTWDPVDRRQRRNLELVRQFVAEHGWTKFSTRTVYEGVKLGGWVNGRRNDYRNGRLDPWLSDQLESIPGWQWHVRP